MSRRPRLDHPGSLHHLTARGVARRTLFTDDDDRLEFLRSLALVTDGADWRCLCYCLMGNHFHLLVRAGDRGISAGMHRLNTRLAIRYNRLYGVDGHVLDKRYANQPVWGEAHALEVVRYLHLNPVRAGLCSDPALWRWSSYRAIAGLDLSPRFLSVGSTLDLFGRVGDAARTAFMRFVEEGMREPEPMSLDDLSRPSLAELVRTLGFEGGRIAHQRYRYPQPLVAAALGISCRTFRRKLAPAP